MITRGLDQHDLSGRVVRTGSTRSRFFAIKSILENTKAVEGLGTGISLKSTKPGTPKSGSIYLVIFLSCHLIGSLSSSTATQMVLT